MNTLVLHPQYPPEPQKSHQARQPKPKKTHTTPLRTAQRLEPPPPHTLPYKPQLADYLNSQDKAQQRALLNKQTRLTFPPNKLKIKLRTKKNPHAPLKLHPPTLLPTPTLK